MASVVFNSGLADAFRGKIDFSKDTFKVMLCTAGYVPDENAHTKRSHVTNEVDGKGYSAGGTSVSVMVTNEDGYFDVSLGAAKWDRATITARVGVYYKSRGGQPSADELIAAIDFGRDVSSDDGEFLLTSSIIRIATRRQSEAKSAR